MRQGRGYLAEFFSSLFFLALPAGASGVQAAALGGFFVVGGDGGVGASKRFQTCQWAAIFFGLDLCPLGQGAHAPGELRVEERDRIIAIAATDAEVARVGDDHFGFRGSKRGKVLHSVLSRENDEVQKLTVSARLKNGRRTTARPGWTRISNPLEERTAHANVP